MKRDPDLRGWRVIRVPRKLPLQGSQVSWWLYFKILSRTLLKTV